MSQTLPTGMEIGFRGGLREEITPHAGVALLIELGRVSRVMATAEHCLPTKKSPCGLGQGQCVESLHDFDPLRRDRGLAGLLGYSLPAASTARQWLDLFHEEELLAGRPVH